MNSKVYILVAVEYDYYRFESNLAVKLNDNDFSDVIGESLWPVLHYKDTDYETIKELADNERAHYWVQEFEV